MAHVVKPALGAKLFVFLIFHLLWPYGSAFRFLHLKSTPRGTKSTTVVASNVRSTQQPKVNF
jgi:hypothetical protein